MLYIPIEHLREGMTLARDLPSDIFGVALLTKGQLLSARVIQKIFSLGLPGAYIESEIASDVVPDEIVDPVLKQKLLTGIKKQFEQYSSHSVMTNKSYDAFSAMSSELVTAVMSKEEIMLNMINIKTYDNYTYSHSMLVGLVAVLIGSKMGLPESALNDLAMCGLMHDIGKLDIPIEITNKPARLTPEEFEVMKGHPHNAVSRLRGNYLFPYLILRGVESHHEKYDGTGYPKGQQGEEIPLYGRILALADVYDALTSKRIYREAWSSGQTIEYMMSLAGTHFDFNLLNVFLSVIAAFPTGSIVRLSDGSTGIVIKNTPGMTLRPTIRLLLPLSKKGTEIDLASDPLTLSLTVLEIVNDLESLLLDLK